MLSLYGVEPEAATLTTKLSIIGNLTLKNVFFNIPNLILNEDNVIKNKPFITAFFHVFSFKILLLPYSLSLKSA